MSQTSPESSLLLSQAQEFSKAYRAVADQIGQVIVGQKEIVDGVLICLFVGGHCLLEGVPGLGKTLLIRSLSQALSLKFSRIQFTPDLMPADITGTTVVRESENGQRDFRFQPGPIFSQIVLADEINRATPKTQSALLEAMQERSVSVAGVTHPLDAPFFVMATQNPIEQEGTYPLPEAQLDRFFFKLLVSPPNRQEMHAILDRTTSAASPTISPVLDGAAIVRCQKLIRQVMIAPHIQDYAVRLVLATHSDSPSNLAIQTSGAGGAGGGTGGGLARQFLRYGASPRAAQTLVLAAKAKALLDGRGHVSLQDIRSVVLAALRHRVLLNFEGQAEGITCDMVLNDLIDHLPAEQPMDEVSMA